MNKRLFLVFLVSLFVGTFIVVQMRTNPGQMIYTSRKAIDDYETMILSEQKTTEDIRKQIEAAEKLLEEYKADSDNPETTIVLDNITSEHDKFAIISGACDVKGPGVVITVDDGNRDLYFGEDINNLLVHDLDILMIINELKDCGAEAISVNGQRIIDSTAINCSGWTIRINGRTYARPFVIEAIGDGKEMVSDLLSPHGYGTSLREWGVQFSIETANEIVIEGYSEERNFFYADVVEGDETEE